MQYKLALILVVIIHLTACALLSGQAIDEKTSNSTNMNQTMAQPEIKADIDALAKAINLPVRPTEARWYSKPAGTNNVPSVPGPTDYSLTAVLKYDDAGAEELIKVLQAAPNDKKLSNVDVESWFPEEVKKEAKTFDDKEKIEGANYAPDSLLRSPFSNGKIVRVGNTNYFIVKVYTS